MSGYVYRIYDDAGALLYIGSTDNVVRRIDGHFKSQWSCAENAALRERFASYDFEVFPTLAEARAAEKVAIHDEAPLLNKMHNPKRWTKVPVTNQYVPVELVSA